MPDEPPISRETFNKRSRVNSTMNSTFRSKSYFGIRYQDYDLEEAAMNRVKNKFYDALVVEYNAWRDHEDDDDD